MFGGSWNFKIKKSVFLGRKNAFSKVVPYLKNADPAFYGDTLIPLEKKNITFFTQI